MEGWDYLALGTVDVSSYLQERMKNYLHQNKMVREYKIFYYFYPNNQVAVY